MRWHTGTRWRTWAAEMNSESGSLVSCSGSWVIDDDVTIFFLERFVAFRYFQ